MSVNQTFLRIRMLKNFLNTVQKHKEYLLVELIDRATDPVVQMRRFRMLSQLSLYEHQTIEKIISLETNDPKDFLKQNFEADTHFVVDRNG